VSAISKLMTWNACFLVRTHMIWHVRECIYSEWVLYLCETIKKIYLHKLLQL
jgi:hypothetical protein